MKRVFIILTGTAMIMAFSMAALNAADVPADGTELAYLEKIVVFNHSTHAAQACEDCHHMWDGSSDVQGCTTAGCHDIMDRKDKTVQSFYKVIHGKGSDEVASCLSCHKEVAGKDKDLKTKLTKCKNSACHPE